MVALKEIKKGIFKRLLSRRKNKGIFENCLIKKANIVSNVDGFRVDLQKSPRIEYQESMFSDTIDVAMVVINSSNRVRGKNLMEGLPLVGTEDFRSRLKMLKEM